MGCKAIAFVFMCQNVTGFTLTMWDVKLVDEDKAEAKAKMFYLNYVGCKDFRNRRNNVV